MLSTYTAPGVKMAWRTGGTDEGHLKPRNQKAGLASAVVCTAKGRQRLPPMSPGPGTGGQFGARELRLGCVVSMLGGGKQRQAT